MLSRDDLYSRLIYLIPDAKFVLWPNDNNADNKGYNNVVIMQDFCIAWLDGNSQSIPSLNEIIAVTDQQITDNNEVIRKAARDAAKATDLTMIACYNVAKVNNPSLTFSAFLDSLEAQNV